MSLQWLYPSVFGFLALLADIGALVAVISFRARPRHGRSARRFERSALLIGAASTLLLAGSIAFLYSTLSPTLDLREEAELYLVVLTVGFGIALVSWIVALVPRHR
ncbi:MAG: hypothetical protein H0V04_03435 [Chloroflexi bacterium]|nr:hypothetical protein [Chloroflexota bacterium]